MKQYHVIGSCHIDLAWIHDAEEYFCYLEQMTVVLLDLLERNPEFTYVIEQAYHYRALQQRRPDLFERLARMVKEGRVEVVGGMISTQETNVPCPESLVRNQLMGAAWFKQNMGAEVKTGWLIDTFGTHAQTPQIYQSFGIRQMLANRHGGDKTADMFWSQGLDGTRLLYAGDDVMSRNLHPWRNRRFIQRFAINGAEIDRLVDSALKTDSDGAILVNIYVEDEWMPNRRSIRALETLREALEKTNAGQARFSLPRDFFDDLRADMPALPVENGDLNPEFTGTFALRSDMRLMNRATEGALLGAETWCALTRSKDGARLREAWWDMCFVYFHDVFTGSHPSSVFADATARMQSVYALSLDATARAVGASPDTRALDEGEVLVVNSLPYARADWAWMATDERRAHRVSRDGRVVPSRQVGGRLGFLADMEATSTRAFRVEALEENVCGDADVPRATLENAWLLLTVDALGGVTLTDKRTGRAVLDGAKDLLVLQNDYGSYQIEEPDGAELFAWTSDVRVTKACDGDCVKASGAFAARFGEQPTTWELVFTLTKEAPMVDLRVNVDWQAREQRLRLKLATTLAGTGEGIYQIPFGVVRRRGYVAGQNKKGEWPAQRFAATENGQAGFALINDGTPGVEIHESVLYSTLLRAPLKPNGGMRYGEECLQHGSHSFGFGLMPYVEDWQKGGVLRASQRFNQPLRAYPASGAQEIATLIALEGDGVELSAVKPPESGEDALVARVYETYGKETEATLYVRDMRGAWKANMAEARIARLEASDNRVTVALKPFEIATILIERA